jgi:DNA-binding CsgD family transcriptional regulator
MKQETDQATLWKRLTHKQRECLDLLLEHKTSKEIARSLRISKYTVDQRLDYARKLLGASNRAETAVKYGRLKQTCDRVACHPVEISDPAEVVPTHCSNEDFEASATEAGSEPTHATFTAYKSWFKDLRRRDHSIYHRVMIMIVLLVLGIIVITAGLNIAQSLTRLISD